MRGKADLRPDLVVEVGGGANGETVSASGASRRSQAVIAASKCRLRRTALGHGGALFPAQGAEDVFGAERLDVVELAHCSRHP